MWPGSGKKEDGVTSLLHAIGEGITSLPPLQRLQTTCHVPLGQMLFPLKQESACGGEGGEEGVGWGEGDWEGTGYGANWFSVDCSQ